MDIHFIHLHTLTSAITSNGIIACYFISVFLLSLFFFLSLVSVSLLFCLSFSLFVSLPPCASQIVSGKIPKFNFKFSSHISFDHLRNFFERNWGLKYTVHFYNGDVFFKFHIIGDSQKSVIMIFKIFKLKYLKRF